MFETGKKRMQEMETSPHTARYLKEIGFDMRILLVEDDENLQYQLNVFLSRFFGQIDTACDGIEALTLYEKRQYDLVMTDLTMPNMGGIELSQKIREINAKQTIFVVSAHSESEKLIDLINIGIDGFILKPFNLSHILNQLTKTCQAIYDHKMLEYFSCMLEETNRELLAKYAELKSKADNQARDALSMTMIKRPPTPDQAATLPERKLNGDEKTLLYTRSHKMSAREFHDAYPFELDKTNEDLEILEDEFNCLAVRTEQNITYETLSELVCVLRDYAKAIELIPQFSALAYGIRQLVETFESVHDTAKLPGMMPMLIHLFDNLEQWRRGIFLDRNVEDIHYMDDSLISDALSLQGMLSNQHASEDAIIELF